MSTPGPVPAEYEPDTLDKLLDLHRDWGELYVFTRIGPDWSARRTDDLSVVLTADTPQGLRELIRADHLRRSVKAQDDNGNGKDTAGNGNAH